MCKRKNNLPPETHKAAKCTGMMLRAVCTLLSFLLLLTILPAREAQAASGQPLQLALKVGSTTAAVNGREVKIQQPFIRNGTVMVPLGVFKKAFGSTVTLEQNDVVKVNYGPHAGAMIIGSTTAWKDGSKIVLGAPPEMVSGVLMVPLRFVAGVLGARITPGNGGGLMVSLVPTETEEAEAESSIDSDVGKTRIGNSYYQWSLNYPAGLVVGDSGGNEAIATFIHAENQYYLEVHAALQETPKNAEELLEELVRAAEESEETILDRAVYPDAVIPYARIVSKDSGGALWEGRQYYADGRLYELYLTDENAANYKDLDPYASLLNSFRPGFDSTDQSIRDLSTVRNGLREGYNEDYGIALQVPADWMMDDQNLVYESRQGSYMKVKVTSAPAGSTLKSWEEELEAKIRDSYVSDAYSIQEGYSAEISGEPALVKETKLSAGKEWNTQYQILLLKNGYRYYVEYVAAAGQEADKAKFKEILASIDIDFEAISQNFGKLETDDYAALSSKTVTKSSKTYGYSVNIPRLWTPYQDLFEMQSVDYRFTGGRLQINVSPEGSAEYTAGLLQSYYQNSKKLPAGPQIESVQESVFAGVPATVLTIHQIKNGIPGRTQIIVFGKNDLVFTVTVTLNDVNATTVQKALIEKTLQSFSL